MKRVLAALAAAVLVAGALVVRNHFIDHPDKTADRIIKGSPAMIGCAPELSDVCTRLAADGVDVTADPVDLDDAAKAVKPAGGQPGIDGWLTYDGSGAVVNFDAPQAYGGSTVVASEQIGILIPSDRGAALTAACGTLSWKCLAKNAGHAWPTVAPSRGLQGTVKIGIGDPRSALAAQLLGPLAVGSADVADPSPDEVRTDRLQPIIEASNTGGSVRDQLNQLVTIGPAAFSLVVAPAPLARLAAATSQGRSKDLTVLYPSPRATVTVELTSADRGVPLDRVVEMLSKDGPAKALEAAGWAAGRLKAAQRVDPGFLYAVRKKVVR